MRVLVACEYSGRVRNAFRTKGHDAWSCDLLESEDASEFHVVGDVSAMMGCGWDLVIAHPPCTYLSNSGVRWLHTDPDRWERMREGADFFLKCLNANSPRVAVENPVMHGHAREIIGRGPDFTVQPWQFGDNQKKRTCFWTRGLPRLKPTSDLDGSTAGDAIHKAPPGPDRWKERSRTFQGIADAMAEQWGNL